MTKPRAEASKETSFKKSFKVGSEVYKSGDTVLMRSPNPGENDFVARIQKMWEGPAKKKQVNVAWFYRPEEANGGRKAFHGERELFDSDHTDWCDIAAINGKCTVHSLKDYQKLDQIDEKDYFIRFNYKARTGMFRPDRVRVYCACEMPYNPDRFMVECDSCSEWYHPECLGLKREEIMQSPDFTCQHCNSRLATNVQTSVPQGYQESSSSTTQGNKRRKRGG